MGYKGMSRCWLVIFISFHLTSTMKTGDANDTLWCPPKFQCILESQTRVPGIGITVKRWRIFYERDKFRIEELTAPTKMVWIYDGNPEWLVWQCYPNLKVAEAVWEARVKHPMQLRAMPYARRFPPTGMQWGWDMPPCKKYENLKYPPGKLLGERQLGKYRCKVFLTRTVRRIPVEIGYAPFIRWMIVKEEVQDYNYVWQYHGKHILIGTEYSCKIVLDAEHAIEGWHNKFFMREIQINPSFAPDTFQIPAGFTVQVPIGVRVHLPKSVKIVRYRATLPPLHEVKGHVPSEK